MIDRRTFVGALFAAGMAPSVRAAAEAADVAALRIGNVPIDSSSAIFAARDQGFLSRAGLAADVQEFSNGGAIAAAVVSGALDIGGINVLTLAAAHERGVPLKIIASGSTYTTKDATTAMLVPKASPLHTARDLTGKTVAVNVLKGIAHVSAQSWIDKNGGDSKSVRFIEIPFATMPATLAANRVDAAVVAEPALSQARDDTRLFAKSYDGIGDLWMIDAWVATDTWIAANAETAKRFGDAMRQAAIWANRNQDKTATFVSSAMKIDPAVVRSMRRATFLEHANLGVVQPVIDVGAQYGALASRFPAAELFFPGALR